MAEKILAIIVTPPSYKASGGVVAGLELSRALAKIMPYEVAIMSDEDKRGVDHEGVAVNFFKCESRLGKLEALVPRALQTALLNPRAIVNYIVQTKPRLVHFHNPHPAIALWVLARACLDAGIPYVMSAHGFVESADPARWLGANMLKLAAYNLLVKAPLKRAVANAKAILLTSPPEHATADALGIPMEKRFIVTNGFTSFFQTKAEDDDLREIKEKFEIDGRQPTFFFVGNHTSNKGIDTLLTACHKARGNWRVVIGGAIRSQEEHARLRRTFNVSDIEKRVVFTDFLSQIELRALYQSVDGFVFPSKADTLPLVILDAMVSGLPVVSTTVGGIPYQVNDKTGRLVKPGDSGALSVALDELAGSAQLRQRLGKAGLNRVQEKFNWDASAQSARTVYNHVLGL